MPWCPNCKTEYQDGYTVCSDCGSTLVESLEQAAAEEAAEYIRDAAASFPDDTGFETEEIQEAQEETLPEGKELLHDKTRHGVYEGASDKAENFKSGAYTLLTAGVIGLVVRRFARMRSASGPMDAVFQSGDLSGDGNDVHRIYRDGSKFLQRSDKKHATQAVAESQLKEELVK